VRIIRTPFSCAGPNVFLNIFLSLIAGVFLSLMLSVLTSETYITIDLIIVRYTVRLVFCDTAVNFNNLMQIDLDQFVMHEVLFLNQEL
jgi:hypothetical protein